MRALFLGPRPTLPWRLPLFKGVRKCGVAIALALFFLVLGEPIPATATADVQRIGVFRDWSIYKADQAQGPVCWLSSRPKRQEGNFTKRGNTHIVITQRPNEKALDVVSIVAGYPLSPGEPIAVQVGANVFELFADGETAWAADTATDRALTQAIRTGTTLIVRGQSSRGTRTTDTYSLAGADEAYRAVAAACGMATP